MNKVFDDYQGEVILKDGKCWSLVGRTVSPTNDDGSDVQVIDDCNYCTPVTTTPPPTTTPVPTTTVAPLVLYTFEDNITDPYIETTGGELADWYWGDGTTTLQNNSPSKTITNPAQKSVIVDVDNDAVTLVDIIYDGVNSLDISRFTNLNELQIHHNYITTLDLTGNPNVETVICDHNDRMTTINLSNNNNLRILFTQFSQISSLDLSQTPNLEEIRYDFTNVTSIDFSQTPNLRWIAGDRLLQPMTSLDVSNLPNLEFVSVWNNPSMTSIDISNSPSINLLNVSGNGLNEAQLDNIILQLDANGVTNGWLDIRNNTETQSCDPAVISAISNLISKGWNVLVTNNPSC